MSLRVAFIGCVESSHVALEALVQMSAEATQVVGLVTRRGSKFNTDFADLSPLARQHELALLYVEDAPTDGQQAEWLGALRPDVVFCVGWSQLLGEQVMRVAPRGVIGFHPAALPANRGRHPLIWALALGLQDTASSFFMIEAEADSGPLLSQVPIAIAADDDAGSLYAKVLAVMPAQIHGIVRELADDNLQPTAQDVSRSNHWRKRGAGDGLIDWRMSASSVANLVRALARPYPGADFLYQGAPVKLWKCAVVGQVLPNLEPGKVLAVDGRDITVKCGIDAVRLINHELTQLPVPGEYL